MRIAFLGLGRMGSAMAGHLLDAGHDLTVWNRTPGRAGDLTARGANEAATPAAAAQNADAVVLMLTGPDSVRDVLLGADGVAGAAAPGTLVVDSSTIGPAAAREFGTALDEAGLRYVEAPVLGSVQPARDGTLTVIAGGTERDYADAEPLLLAWGATDKVRRVGEVGAANSLKVVVNLTLGVAIAGVGEALRLARDLGVEQDVALEVMANGPFGSTVQQKRSMVESGDFSATAFSLDLLVKDLGLAVDAAQEELPVTAAALAHAREAADAGHGPDDYAAVAGFVGFEGRPDSY